VDVGHYDEDLKKELVEKGVAMKAEYDRLLSSCTSTAGNREKKPFFDHCKCEDCFTESEPEELSDTEANQVKSKYPKRSVLLQYPRYAAGIQVKRNDSGIRVTKNFSMSSITSILDLLPSLYRGLQIPYYYVGEEHSCFPAHTEDGALYAANYLHLGFPKIWSVANILFYYQYYNLIFIDKLFTRLI